MWIAIWLIVAALIVALIAGCVILFERLEKDHEITRKMYAELEDFNEKVTR